jgi:predicted nucleic acid-binding protein
MTERFYLDTSIWLDFLEKRDEPNFPKGVRAKELVENIIQNGGKIILSDVIKNEMIGLGYPRYDIDSVFIPFYELLIHIHSDEKQVRRAKDLSNKRGVPLLDALHAILARDSHAMLITRDKHFDKLLDISNYKKPEDLI